MSRRYSAAACLLGLALIAPLPAQETLEIQNWSAPPFWTPAKAVKPDDAASSAQPMAVEGAASPMPFIATVPCRVVDTRNAPGPYGGPAIAGGAAARTFAIPGGPCPGIPIGAGAFSINVAAILPAADGFLTVFPTGVAQPLSSDLNFLGGEVIANALIVPAGGASASINVFANVTTHLIIDINGYYLPNGLDSTYVNEGQASSVTSGMIVDGTIVNADINASAAIADTKLATIATPGKVADTALSGNVSKLGGTIESGEITDEHVGAEDIQNLTRFVSIPLTSFVDCETTGALIDFSSGADNRADFAGFGTNGTGFYLEFDAVVGQADQGSEVCATFTLPTDYLSNGLIRLLTSKSGNTAPTESVTLALGRTAVAMEAPVSGLIGSSDAGYLFVTVAIPANTALGFTLRMNLSVTSPTTMNDAVRILAVDFAYTASR